MSIGPPLYRDRNKPGHREPVRDYWMGYKNDNADNKDEPENQVYGRFSEPVLLSEYYDRRIGIDTLVYSDYKWMDYKKGKHGITTRDVLLNSMIAVEGEALRPVRPFSQATAPTGIAAVNQVAAQEDAEPQITAERRAQNAQGDIKDSFMYDEENRPDGDLTFEAFLSLFDPAYDRIDGIRSKRMVVAKFHKLAYANTFGTANVPIAVFYESLNEQAKDPQKQPLHNQKSWIDHIRKTINGGTG